MQEAVGHRLGRIASHLCTADGRERVAHAGIEQAQIVVDFGGSAHGRARIAGCHLLLDGNGGRQTLDVVALRLVHTSQELAGVGGQAFHIAALAFGIQGVEGQRGFARPRKTCDDNKLIARQFEGDILEIIDAGAFYLDSFHGYSSNGSVLPTSGKTSAGSNPRLMAYRATFWLRT